MCEGEGGEEEEEEEGGGEKGGHGWEQVQNLWHHY